MQQNSNSSKKKKKKNTTNNNKISRVYMFQQTRDPKKYIYAK